MLNGSVSGQIFQPVENSSGAFLTYLKSRLTRSRLTAEKTFKQTIFEDCNYVDDDSRRQNNMQRILKGKLRLCQFLLHFTTYFPNVSYVNSERPRMEGCSNEGKKKARQGAGRKGGDN